MNFPTTYLVWDLETTGLLPKQDRIVEVACMGIEAGGGQRNFQAILNHKIDIPEQASNIHGITTERASQMGVDPISAISHLKDRILEADAIISHNGIRFDIPFLLEEMRRLGYSEYDIGIVERNLEEKTIDTAAVFKAHKLGIERQWYESFYQFCTRILDMKVYGLKYNVAVCCEDLKIDITGITQHRAFGDVTLTEKIYRKLCLQE